MAGFGRITLGIEVPMDVLDGPLRRAFQQGRVEPPGARGLAPPWLVAWSNRCRCQWRGGSVT